jgi:hypothetical protein
MINGLRAQLLTGSDADRILSRGNLEVSVGGWKAICVVGDATVM